MDDPLRSEGSPRIDWETAEVSGGELRVALAGEAPKGWPGRAREVLERLAGRDGERPWGKVKLTRREIVVRDVADGAESDLRHELESAVLQTNADLRIGADAGAARAEDSTEPGADERMTAVFREFARGA